MDLSLGHISDYNSSTRDFADVIKLRILAWGDYPGCPCGP